VGDAEYIAIILILLIVVLALVWAVVYLCKILFRVEEKLSDIELELHFATDNYLLNERQKQRENGAELVG
jgi:predicted Holliday junction resolvase-like endonuclease